MRWSCGDTAYRWADLVITLHWLHERTGEAWLLGLAEKLKDQGFPWRTHVEHFPYRARSRHEECDLRSHGPNNAMGVKAPGIWYRQSGDPADRDAVTQMIATLDRYHGQATGMFTCDEHLAGLNPSQGSQVCAVVEYMYSLETVIPVLSEPALGDLRESLTFNALPATLTPNMWARQYDQQVNQVQCLVGQDRVYTSNGPNANIYGFEPHFGCCTPNHAQGWPKFAAPWNCPSPPLHHTIPAPLDPTVVGPAQALGRSMRRCLAAVARLLHAYLPHLARKIGVQCGS